jgi:hypothetical protein
MRKWFVLAGVFALTLSIAGLSDAGPRPDDDPIKTAMKEAMKGGLCKNVAEGKASPDEKKKLVELFKGMLEAKPPKGDEGSWKEKCEALVKAAEAAVAGKSDASAQLKTAANCKACHDVHKGQ